MRWQRGSCSSVPHVGTYTFSSEAFETPLICISAGEEHLQLQKLFRVENYMYSPDLVWNISPVEETRQEILILNESQTLLQACGNVQHLCGLLITAHSYVLQSQQQVLLFTSKALDSASLYTAGITWGNSHLVWNVSSVSQPAESFRVGSEKEYSSPSCNSSLPDRGLVRIWAGSYSLRKCFLFVNDHKHFFFFFFLVWSGFRRSFDTWTSVSDLRYHCLSENRKLYIYTE